MTGPQDPTAAGGDRLMASHADREQVIETLKDAFMQGRLTGDELGAQAGRALAARTRADLAALTADIRAADIRAAGIPAAGIPAESADLIVAGPTRPPAPVRRRPLARAAAGSGGCLVIAFAALRLVSLADPGATPGPIPMSWALPCLVVAIAAVVAALFILGYGVGASIEQRRSRRQLPPQLGPGAA